MQPLPCLHARLALIASLLLAALPLRAADDYQPGPDSQPQPGVPLGEVRHGTFDQSKIFPGTTRDYWVYVPNGLDPARPAPVMIFQDGLQYSATNVLNNLIHKREIPPLVGIFVQPGVVKAIATNALDRFNRSYEYDGLGDSYARFLLEELLPYVTAQHGLNLSTNGNDRGIAGASSGAICAFTAAWERPDAFRRVFSSIGTYVGLRGGNDYPTLIRKTEPKPIRIFLQDGSGDLNIYGGDWWMANQEMERALIFVGYDVNHAWGDGGHNGKHATAIFPEALRWLWRDWPAPIVKPWKPSTVDSTGRVITSPTMDVLVENEDWQLVSTGHKFTEGPTANAKGEVFFVDIPNNRIHKIGLDCKVTVFAENTGGASGLKFGADGRLYACAGGKKQIVTYDANARPTVIAEDIGSNDFTLMHDGNLYVTDPGNKQLWLVTPTGEKRVVDQGITFANGVCLTPDQSLLLVADTRGQFVFSFQIQPDGSLAHKQRYFHLHLPDASTGSGADGMCVDTTGRLYVTTELGVQFCDQAGRVNGIISKPKNAWLSNVAFGGAKFDELYVTCGDEVFKRKTRVQGALNFQPPFKPAAPRL